MSRRLKVTWLAVTLLAGCVHAATADELATVERKICAEWMKHKSMSAKMELQSRREGDDAAFVGGGQGTYEYLQKGEQMLSRLEVLTQYGRQSVDEKSAYQQHALIYADGTYEYVLRNMGGRQMAMKLRMNPELFPIPPVIFETRRRDSDLELLPEELVDGQKVYVIAAKLREPGMAPVAKHVYYFLQDSGALLKKVGHNDQGTAIEATIYSDFKFDVDFKPEHFVFKAPEGVTVIDRTEKKP